MTNPSLQQRMEFEWVNQPQYHKKKTSVLILVAAVINNLSNAYSNHCITMDWKSSCHGKNQNMTITTVKNKATFVCFWNKQSLNGQKQKKINCVHNVLLQCSFMCCWPAVIFAPGVHTSNKHWYIFLG